MRQVAKHEIPGLARDMVNAYAGFLRDHYNELGADGEHGQPLYLFFSFTSYLNHALPSWRSIRVYCASLLKKCVAMLSSCRNDYKRLLYDQYFPTCSSCL